MAHSKQTASHGKEIYYILCIMFIIGFATFSVFGPGGYLEMKQVQYELETHRTRVDSLRQENDRRLQTIRELKSDKSAMEKYAREKGYGKAGEVIQQIPDESPAPPQPKH